MAGYGRAPGLTMVSATSEMTELTVRDQESDSDGDFDLDSDDLYTDVVYLNTVDDERAHTKRCQRAGVCNSQ